MTPDDVVEAAQELDALFLSGSPYLSEARNKLHQALLKYRAERQRSAGCISAAPTGCVSDSECAAAGRCLLIPESPPETSLRSLLDAVATEILQAEAKWPPMNSAHEAYAVLLEEVDELWDHVKTNQKRRDLAAMRTEALQVAAMALRFIRDVCREAGGRK